MAGGMRSRNRPTLADRSAATQERAAGRDGDRSTPATAAAARHCWAEPPGAAGRWPGLVVEWRRDRSGSWHGRCVYAVDDPDGAVRVVERWLPASCLSPATAGMGGAGRGRTDQDSARP